jgi:hypothetical protein
MTISPSTDTVDAATAARFVQDHFGQANLGHKKRNECLHKVAAQICRHPGSTLPNKFASPAGYKAMDRLMNRPEVTHASVLQSHLQRTRQQLEATNEVVLLLHDTTELDYSGLHSITELGPIGNGGGRGYLCHNTLAVLPGQREVLGLAHQILHTRVPVPPNETLAQKRQRETRESRLWTQAVQALGPAPASKPWVDVADRGADIFEFLATEDDLQRACLVRATHNRAIVTGHEGAGERAQLFDYLRGLPAGKSKKSKKVYDTESREERQAQLSISFAAVRLLPPHKQRGEYVPRPLAVWVIRVWEAHAATGVTPVEWFLVLNRHAITTEAEAWEKSDWYGCRPMVEEYHKCQKTGCAIEALQFESAAALQPMIALLSVVAVMLLQLREAFRRADAATRSATELVDAIYEEVLREWRSPGREGTMTVQEYFLALARLGGHMNRKRDGAPGWLVLWRGWMKLQAMVDGVEAERRRQKRRHRESQFRGEV